MNIGVIGLGLIGGSLAKAIKKNTAHTVYGYDINPDVMLKASLLNAFDEILTADNANCLDLLIVSLYPQATVDAIASWTQYLKNGCIVIDTAGEKRKITSAMSILSEQFPNIYFIGAHPMAGREFSGIAHAQVNLFEKCSVILTPVNADLPALSTVKKLFLDIGSEGIVITDPFTHDKMISYTSQMAHLVSNAYVRNPLSENHYGFSAGSFRDMTRVAKINSQMWTELMLDNSDNLLTNLDIFIANMIQIREAIASDDKAKLQLILDEGNDRKVKIESSKAKKLAQNYNTDL